MENDDFQNIFLKMDTYIAYKNKRTKSFLLSTEMFREIFSMD